jgi:lipopolysaccharide export system permease protein
MKKIDWYIIKKFLGTYVFTIVLILSIAIVLDYNENMDKFTAHEAPWKAIIFQYYLNYIPYFANLFSPLFVFVAVIFFTSKLAGNSEIIAMLASGISFNRLLRPYLISATVIALFTFSLNSFIIPKANIKRIEFRNHYIRDKETKVQNNNQFMVEPGVVAYFNNYNKLKQTGTGFALEKFEGKQLVSRLTADRAVYQGDYLWHITDYQIRTITDTGETLVTGAALDSTITIAPEDIIISKNDCEKMTTPELQVYIDKQQFRGVGNIKDFEIEYHKRWAAIATSYILTLIGVSLSSRKVKGGMGVNIGIGLVLSFIYILFQTVSSTFAVSGEMSVVFAVWLPNIVFAVIAYYLYLKAPR